MVLGASQGITISGSPPFEERIVFRHVVPEAATGERREERLDGVEPGAGGRREMEHPAGMPAEPAQDLGCLMGGDVVEDHMDELPGRHRALDRVQEAEEFLMPVALHAASEHGAIEHVERGVKGCRSVSLVIVRHRATSPGLQRQARLGRVDRLDLALFVDRQHDRMGRRVHVEADDIAQLVGERGVFRALEGAQTMGLQRVRLPDPLHRGQRNPHRRGHRPAGPVGGFAGRLGAGEGHHPLHGLRPQRFRSGRTGLVAEQPVEPSSAKRCCRRHTVVRPTPTVVPMRRTGRRSAANRTMRARSTCFCGRFRPPITAARRARSSALTITQTD